MNQTSPALRRPIQRIQRLLALLACTLLPATPALAGVELAQQPLTVAISVEPNIMFILDDSGSMAWQHMPGTTASWHNSQPSGLPLNGTIANDIRLRAGNVNTQWYNPLITYEPWLKHDGSVYKYPASNGNVPLNAAPIDPSGKLGSSTFNFESSLSSWPSINMTTTGSDTASWRYSGFYLLTGSNPQKNQSYTRYEFRYECTQTEQQCTRYYSNGTCRTWTDVCIASTWKARKITLNSNGNNNVTTNLAQFDWSAYGGPTRTVAEEIQNYANWYSYYRTRITMAKAAASRVFAKLGSGYRVGFDTLQYNAKSSTPVYPIPVGTDDGRFTGNNKKLWFDKLFATGASNGTSLREALSRSGEYYSDKVNSLKGGQGPYGPETGANQISCRANFAILTTDGYWNGNSALISAAQADTDSQDGTEITGPSGSYQYKAKRPYMDSRSNTLADVAMYYWKTDLMPGMDNLVPTTAKNPAFWQNMRTYGISIGEKGTLTPDQTTLDRLTAGTLSWPTPGNDKQENIDDLWHAALNSRGEFIVANDPEEFARALSTTLDEIGNETKHAASGGASSASLEAGTKVYFSQYTSGSWSGRVYALELDENTGKRKEAEAWDAESALPDWQDRNIFVNVSGELKPLIFSNLTGPQKTHLNSADVVNYLRGDRSKENTVLRKRDSLLPAFINTQLVYVGKPSDTAYYAGQSAAGSASYAAFANDYKERAPVVYISGSDGMVHGFHGDTGEEIMAFLPNFSITEKLKNYTDPRYGTNDVNDPDWEAFHHQYILDGELTVADVYLDGWKTILVGTQGRGGKGVFALDVTDPEEPSLIWEKSAADSNALGNNLGKPLIAQVADGDWRVLLGNGPNSTGDYAQLVMISLIDGSISNVNTFVGSNNGLAGVNAWDSDGDGFFDTAYAGDLKGNVWRFTDLAGNATAHKLLSSSANSRPITSMPLVVRNQKTQDTWVFVGTGQFLNEADMSNTSQQTWYGLLDNGTEITSRDQLKKRNMQSSGIVSGTPVRTLEAGTAAEITSAALRGWYIDFNLPGERMISPNTLLAGALFGITYVPDGTNRCQPDGKSSIWAINPFSGARLNQGLFDLNKNGKIDASEKLGDAFPSVLDGLEAIMGGQPPIIKGKDGKATLEMAGSGLPIQLPTGALGRQSWREIIRK